jgi:nucleoside-diphosphate-sugar epimerase
MTAQWRFSRGYVDNVASAIVLAVTMDEAKGRTYNVGEPGTLTELEWYEKSSRGVGWKGEILVIPEVDLPEHLRRGTNLDQHWVVDTSRIREELGFHEIVSQDEGIARAIEWDRSNPPLQFDEERYGKLDYAADDAALEILRARHPDRGLQIYHARKA